MRVQHHLWSPALQQPIERTRFGLRQQHVVAIKVDAISVAGGAGVAGNAMAALCRDTVALMLDREKRLQIE